MPIQDNDLFLVNTGGESYQCAAEDLVSKASAGLMLVNRKNDQDQWESFKALGGELPTKLKEDDLMLVNRGNQSFKATGAEVLEYIGGGGTPEERAIDGLTTLYTGTGTGQTIRTGVDMTNGGLIWILGRDSEIANNAIVANEIGKQFIINEDSAPTNTSNIASVGTNGFTLGNSASYNTLGNNYVAWSWPNLPNYFDCVEYTGDGRNANSVQSISHNLGTEPGMIIVKAMSGNKNYFVYHCGASGNRSYQSCFALNNATYSGGPGFWGSQPTNTAFEVQGSNINADGVEYKAWLWPKSSPYVYCDGYTGNGEVGRIINLPSTFQGIPQWIMLKVVGTSTSNWRIYDCYRDFNGAAPYQYGAARGLLRTDIPEVEVAMSNGVAFGVSSEPRKNFNPETTNGSNSNNQNNKSYIYTVIASPALAASRLT